MSPARVTTRGSSRRHRGRKVIDGANSITRSGIGDELNRDREINRKTHTERARRLQVRYPSAVIPIVANPRDSQDSDTSISTDSASIILNGEPSDTFKPPLCRHSSIFTEELPENVEFASLFRRYYTVVMDRDETRYISRSTRSRKAYRFIVAEIAKQTYFLRSSMSSGTLWDRGIEDVPWLRLSVRL